MPNCIIFLLLPTILKTALEALSLPVYILVPFIIIIIIIVIIIIIIIIIIITIIIIIIFIYLFWVKKVYLQYWNISVRQNYQKRIIVKEDRKQSFILQPWSEYFGDLLCFCCSLFHHK